MIMICFGVLFAIFGVYAAISTVAGAREYEEAHDRYQQRRHTLLARQRRLADGQSPGTDFKV